MKPDKKHRAKQSPAKKKLAFGLFSYWSMLGMILGAGGGIVYHFTYGYQFEGCAIVSNPYMSAIWGALLALVVFEIWRIISIEDPA